MRWGTYRGDLESMGLHQIEGGEEIKGPCYFTSDQAGKSCADMSKRSKDRLRDPAL